MLEPSKGKTKISARYRVSQPMRNFRIRVRIAQQTSPLAELFDSADETRDGNFLEEEEREFNWQEKRLGPFEARYYRDERNCTTDQQKEYHRRVIDADSPEQLGSRLYSYVQADGYYPPGFEEPLALGCTFRSPLAKRNENALPIMPNRKPFSERHNRNAVDEKPSLARIRQSHYLYKEEEKMYIMADLSPKDETGDESTDSEVLLCSISFDPLHKCLTVNPDFTSDECYSVDGFGMSYDYWIEHVSPRPTSRELQKRRDSAKKELERLRSVKDACLFNELRLSSPRTLRIFCSLDIASATNFDAPEGLFASYHVQLRNSKWKCLSGMAGRTQRCSLAKNGKMHLSYCADVILEVEQDSLVISAGDNSQGNGLKEETWPHLLFSVASLDSWTRYRIEGYAYLPLPREPCLQTLNLRTWRPSAGFVDNLRRTFTGGTSELDDLTYCSLPATHEGPTLDKSGLTCIPSGSLEIRLNCIHQSQRFITEQRNWALDPMSAKGINAGRLLDNVDDVLSQFKAARERMIQNRAMCL
ncbi:hypothetical protein QAD02_011201 [Eretmocerus hayati]|uniref:Uncharacterized protein n=1 Tax=Eretmocerus hayati TaxID=131215 RepID=A0ACC2NVV2_9HYME|nr:hypothetical protein QAD02_011201 [Eretmocerus hayati]